MTEREKKRRGGGRERGRERERKKERENRLIHKCRDIIIHSSFIRVYNTLPLGLTKAFVGST